MTIELGPNRYGKSAIRLVKVIRDGARHTIRDLTVDIALEGDFAAAHTVGDNVNVVATDTMKNTVYALAPEHLTGSIERFALTLARHHLGAPQVHGASVTIGEHGWSRMPTADGAADDAFVRRGDMTRTALVSLGRDGAVTIGAGIEDLVVMKTGKSSFAGFPRDDYTTLPDTDDRIMATKVTAEWRYTTATAGDASFDYDGAFGRVRDTLLHVMATHRSTSVQASIWIVGRAMLEAHAELDEVHLQLPNLHHWLVDLSPFGLHNEREIFVATTQPHGLIDATVRRGG